MFAQVKTIWAFLLRHFEFALPGPFPEADYESMVVGPKKGQCTVTWRRRELQ